MRPIHPTEAWIVSGQEAGQPAEKAKIESAWSVPRPDARNVRQMLADHRPPLSRFQEVTTQSVRLPNAPRRRANYEREPEELAESAGFCLVNTAHTLCCTPRIQNAWP